MDESPPLHGAHSRVLLLSGRRVSRRRAISIWRELAEGLHGCRGVIPVVPVYRVDDDVPQQEAHSTFAAQECRDGLFWTQPGNGGRRCGRPTQLLIENENVVESPEGTGLRSRQL